MQYRGIYIFIQAIYGDDYEFYMNYMNIKTLYYQMINQFPQIKSALTD